MTLHCTAATTSSVDPLFNVTQVLQQRWDDSAKHDRKRLELCWGYQDCGDCHRSKGSCGWCPISSTCLPLPEDRFSRAFPLLSPTRHKFICAMGPERFELRTSGLGCQVSTITFLTSIVTIFSTMFGLLILYCLVKTAKLLLLAFSARTGGWIVYEDRSQEVWLRKGESWGRWWRRWTGRQHEFEVEEIDGGTRERSWWAWRRIYRSMTGRRVAGETQPLLT